MAQRRRRSISQNTSGGIGSQLPNLSLFVMLLAFFMILNSMSSYEEQKTESIMQSLDDTFASKITETGNDKPSITNSSEKQLGEGDTLERIEALFKAQISGYEIVMNKQRGVMQMQVPRAEFESAVNGMAAPEKSEGFSAAFLPTLVSLMRTASSGSPYRMEITYYLDENPARIQNQEPQRMAKTVRDVAAIARKIETAGLQAKLMTVGLQKGDPDMVELFFQKHIPFQPKGTGVAGDQQQGVTDEQEKTPE